MPFLSENSWETLSFWSTYYIYRIIHTYILRPHFPCHLNILVMEVAKSFDFSEIERKNVGEKWVAKACPDPSSSKPCRIGHASPISPSTAFLATSSEATALSPWSWRLHQHCCIGWGHWLKCWTRTTMPSLWYTCSGAQLNKLLTPWQTSEQNKRKLALMCGIWSLSDINFSHIWHDKEKTYHTLISVDPNQPKKLSSTQHCPNVLAQALRRLFFKLSAASISRSFCFRPRKAAHIGNQIQKFCGKQQQQQHHHHHHHHHHHQQQQQQWWWKLLKLHKSPCPLHCAFQMGPVDNSLTWFKHRSIALPLYWTQTTTLWEMLQLILLHLAKNVSLRAVRF